MKIDINRIEDFEDFDLPKFEPIPVNRWSRAKRPQDVPSRLQAGAIRERAKVFRDVHAAIEALGLPERPMHEFRLIRPHVEEDAFLAKMEERRERKRLRFKKPSKRKEALKFQK